MPGTKSLSIASVGCNLRCQWCFPSGVKILTNRGVLNIEEIIENPTGIQIISHKGNKQRIKTAFKRIYNGRLINVNASHIPPIRCTPNHRIYAAIKPLKTEIKKIPASDLRKNYYLILPKKHSFSQKVVLDNKSILEKISSRYRVHRKISFGDIQEILDLSRFQTSKTIGKNFNLHPAYVRTLRSQLEKESLKKEDFYERDNELVTTNSKIFFKTEKKPYINRFLKLDKDLAYLLGFYCAEGWVHKSKDRPNSHTLCFALSKQEKNKASMIRNKFRKVFGVKLSLRKCRTCLQLSTSKGSIALIFKLLCGDRAYQKNIPEEIFKVEKLIVQEFLNGYVAGDGYIDKKGQIIINTVSEKLAYSVYGLWLKLGYLPGFYKWEPPSTTKIENRSVSQRTLYYVKVWPGKRRLKSRYYEDDEFFYVPILNVERKQYSGLVYNLEIEKDHSYLANFIGVSNCQNDDISQCTKEGATRDEIMNKIGVEMEPAQIVFDAQKQKLPSISYTYTEPTIFLEFALDTMKLAKKAGLKNVWVSNGYMTKVALDLISPYLDAINVDLKGFDNEKYLKYSGAKLQPVLDNIKDIFKRKIHIEVTTLVVPGVNDDEKELKSIAEFLASISKNIPWHISRFFPAYKMMDVPPTPLETLKLAEKLGKKAGLKYIHLGNI
jgi:pyruvate-formate lyase-activating enzyme/ribosomal protein L23